MPAIFAGVLALLVGPAAPALAQEAGVGGGAVFELYTFSDPEASGFESVSLLTAPFGAAVEVGGGLLLSVDGAWARGELDDGEGGTFTISGLTDTALRATWSDPGDLVTLSAAAILPTGTVEHTLTEARVAGVVAYDLLPFRISNWGSGGGADASVAVARSVNDRVSLGGRVGYRVVAEHEPFDANALTEGAFVYDPGDQFYARAAVDALVGAASRLALSLTWQTFGDDASEGTNLFRTGDRLQGMATLAFPTVLEGSGWVYAGAQHRTEGTFLEVDRPPERPAQTLFFGGVGGRFLVSGTAALPSADIRILRTEDGLGQGWTAGLGTTLEIPLGDGPELVPTVRLRFGNVLVSEDVETGFTGLEIGATVRGVGR